MSRILEIFIILNLVKNYNDLRGGENINSVIITHMTTWLL